VLCNIVLYLLKLVKGSTCTIVTHLKSLSCLSVYLKVWKFYLVTLKTNMTWEKEQSMSAVIDFIFAYTLHVPSEKLMWRKERWAIF
jgi:hypothetical protein